MFRNGSFTEVYFNAANCADANANDPPFQGCGGTIVIGANVERIPAYMFGNAGFTGSLTIPNTVTTLGNYAFYGCSGFTGSLTIPNSVTTIGNGAFYGCSGFTGSLTIGNSVTAIGGNEFEFEGVFQGCNGFTGSLTIPNSVTKIGKYAFQDCTGFTDGLTIGNSVTTIGSYAFSNCTGFTGMNSLAETPPSVGSSAFYDVDHSIPVTVPCGTIDAYQNASGWSQFTNIQQEDCTIEIIAVANPVEGGMVTGAGTYEIGA